MWGFEAEEYSIVQGKQWMLYVMFKWLDCYNRSLLAIRIQQGVCELYD